MANPNDRPGVTYRQAKEILEAKGIVRTIRTLRRWAERGILSIKRITGGTTILFRDELEALAEPDDPKEQRILSAKAGRKRQK